MKRIYLSLPLVSAMALSGCMNAYEPQTYPSGQGENKRTITGAAIGATLGGLLGATTSDEKKVKRGLIGAAVGGAVGGAIGLQLDKQKQELEAQLGNEVRIENTGSELIVTMPQDILFASDSAALNPSLESDLAAVARSLQNYPDTTVQIIGHTDNTGTAQYNQDLSTRRASAVAGVLINNGVRAGRLIAFGRGEDQPLSTNLTEEGKALNRRVELIITPNTQG